MEGSLNQLPLKGLVAWGQTAGAASAPGASWAWSVIWPGLTLWWGS